MPLTSEQIVIGFECLIYATGLILLARTLSISRLREKWFGRSNALPAWTGTWVDLLLLLWLSFTLGFLAQWGARAFFGKSLAHIEQKEIWEIAIYGGLLQVGGLVGASLFYLTMQRRRQRPDAAAPISQPLPKSRAIVTAIGVLVTALPTVAAVSLAWIYLLKTL
ncbi:MAG TPA: hypothetical protein VKC60_00725, partial [Opitutaceae bacterium]|nr:hypothetical protein [Opitutaceae bacterium]